MKTFFGLIQFACGIGGLIALFNGQWLSMLASWGIGFVVGIVGSRMVRITDGVSQGGQDAFSSVNNAIALLRRGQFTSAIGNTRSAIFSFRTGGDRDLLTMTLLLHAVALAANRDAPGAQKALDEVASHIRVPSPAMASEVPWMRDVISMVHGELSRGVPDPERLVQNYFDIEAN